MLELFHIIQTVAYIDENYYVEIDGGDYFPDMMLGRFTNQSDYTLQVMVNKFQLYEQTPYTATTDWFKKGICCSNNAYASQVETKRFAAERMLVDGSFTSVDTMMSDPGCTYSVADVVNAVNDGRSFVNYRGEGWTSGWGLGGGDNCTPMKSSDVSNLSNGQKLTFVTSIGCGVAMFGSGESLVKHGLNWEHFHNREVVHVLSGHVGIHIQPTIIKLIKVFMWACSRKGSILPVRDLQGEDSICTMFMGTDPDVEYHYKIYCVLGDPSMHMWKEIPLDVNVSYPGTTTVGSNFIGFTVNHTASGLPVENAIVCVTGNNVFTSGTTDATGNVLLEINS